jgi:hypothetical protein
MRPKVTAIEKLFYVLFSVDATLPQPLAYWQCLASLTNLYSQVLHGMHPFVAPQIRMTHKEHNNCPRKANANAQFAIEIWRTIILIAYVHPPSVAITIQEYLGAPRHARHFIVITDASPRRLCAALYDPTSPQLANIPPALRTRHTRAIPSATRIPRPLTCYDTSRSLWPPIGKK